MTIAGMHASDILQLLWVTTQNAGALAILVALVTLLGRRWIAPRYRCLMWTLVALRLAIPIAPASPFSMQQLWMSPDESPAVDAGFTGLDVAISVFSPHADPLPPAWTPARKNEMAPSPVTPAGMLLTIWTSGALISVLILGVTTIRFQRKLRRCAVSGDPERRQLLDECRQLTRVRRHVRLLEVPGLHSPAQMGLFRPTVLLPADLANTFSQEQLRHVFLHELAHVKRRDVAVNGLLALLRILHWWNPLYWLVQSRLIAKREQACDVQVLKCLGAAEGHAYGETLLEVVTRLTAAAERGLTLPTSALGLVTFLGQKSSLRRRLRSLKDAGRGELKVQQFGGALLTLVLLVVGATDRPNSDAVAEDRAFQIPADTTWSLATVREASDELLITRVYVVGDELDILARESGISRDEARILIEQAAKSQFPLQRPDAEDDVARHLNWYDGDQVPGEAMIVRAVLAEHEALAELLSVWRTHGPDQISLEVRLITASDDQPLPLGRGGRIISPGTGSLSQHSAIGSRSEEFPVNPAGGARGRIISERRVPVYVQTLRDELCRQIVQAAQSDARSNIMFAPKITLFNGQQATVTSAVQRPFVTGLDDSSGSIEPQIEVIQDGLSLALSAVSVTNTGTIRLDCHLSLDTIVDVSETRVTRGDAVEPLTIQVPQVESQQYAATAELAEGESLLMSPLYVDGKGRRLYVMITPQRMDPDRTVTAPAGAIDPSR